MCDQQRLRPAWTYPQSDQSHCSPLKYSLSVKLLTEHRYEFLSLNGGCTGLSESTLVKMPHCWTSHVAAHLYMTKTMYYICFFQNSKHISYISYKLCVWWGLAYGSALEVLVLIALSSNSSSGEPGTSEPLLLAYTK